MRRAEKSDVRWEAQNIRKQGLFDANIREKANAHERVLIMTMSWLRKYFLLPGRSKFFKTLLNEGREFRKRVFRQSQR